jgi:RHS repeat-associated protein
LTLTNSFNQPIEDYQYRDDGDDELIEIVSRITSQQLPASRDAGVANGVNQIGQFGDASYSFDLHGQTVSKTNAQGTTGYRWDARGRLNQVTLPDGGTVNYSYDAMGRLAGRSTESSMVNYMYDGMNNVIDQRSDGSSIDYLNAGGIDQRLRQTSSGGAPLYFLADHLGSTTALTDAFGNVIDVQQYEAFGQNAGSALTRFGYSGRERDSATGLLQYRARWYDPQQGRFLSEDPLGFKAGINLYSYVRNNPLGSFHMICAS